MDELRQKRLAHNEAKFRSINEHVTAKVDDFRGGTKADDTYSLLCECALEDCELMLDVTGGEYERVRGNATWFLVAPRHMIDEIEQPLEKTDGYWVIEKIGAGRVVTKATDPRG